MQICSNGRLKFGKEINATFKSLRADLSTALTKTDKGDCSYKLCLYTPCSSLLGETKLFDPRFILLN